MTPIAYEWTRDAMAEAVREYLETDRGTALILDTMTALHEEAR
jgi:hypothetical protein